MNRAPSHQPKSHPRRGHASPGNPARGLPVSHRPRPAHPQKGQCTRGRLRTQPPQAAPPWPTRATRNAPTHAQRETHPRGLRAVPPRPTRYGSTRPQRQKRFPPTPKGACAASAARAFGRPTRKPHSHARSLTAAISRTENASTGAVRGFLALLRGGFSPSCVGGGRGEALPQLRRWWRVGRRAVRVGFRNGQPCRHRLLHRVPGAALALAPRCVQRQHRVSLPYQ